MPYEKFLIAPLTQGWQNNVKPWLILDEAFFDLRNLYTWRGSVKKRFGGRVMNGAVNPPFDQLFTRLRINLGPTNGAGNLAGVVPGTKFRVGQMFSIGDELFTVNIAGAPAVMLATGASIVHTYDTTNGAFVITGSNALTDVFFYPADPVMHFGTYDITTVNDEDLFAFDTQFAYRFIYANGWSREATGGLAAIWTGSDSDFFFTSNYRGAASNNFLMFITNNIVADGFRYWDGTTFAQLGTAATTPINAAADFIVTCKIILPFKDRLVLFNVTENIAAAPQVFQNRIRFSQNGSPIDPLAWRQDIVGRGGFLEAPVKEAIIGAEFLKDRLIVYFENSTWELLYTGNEVLPFTFQQLDTNLGVESTNSVIAFDKVVLGFGSNGLHACNGVNVNRIDETIPNTIFDVRNNNDGPQRVNGIRDFFVELVYWAFSSTTADTGNNSVYPNRVLVYDYVNNTWAYNDDSITAFGNFYLQQTLTWQDISDQWQDMDEQWNDPSFVDRFKSTIAGNQEGYTFLVDAENNKNSVALQITDITVVGPIVTFTVINHNLAQNEAVFITDIQAVGGNMATAGILNDTIVLVNTTGSNSFTINTGVVQVTGTYTGGGVLTRVSLLSLTTKQYNFYNKAGMNIAFQQALFMVDKTANGQITVNWFVSASNVNLLTDGNLSGANIGTGILETTPYAIVSLENTQDRFWHSIYFNSVGENIQLQLSFSNDQLTTPNIAFSDFQLNALLFYATQTNQFGG